MSKSQLLAKLKRGQKLSKSESDALGPLTNRDLAPITGDAFVDGLLLLQGDCLHEELDGVYCADCGEDRTEYSVDSAEHKRELKEGR
jgi:hypothetical protein